MKSTKTPSALLLESQDEGENFTLSALHRSIAAGIPFCVVSWGENGQLGVFGDEGVASDVIGLFVKTELVQEGTLTTTDPNPDPDVKAVSDFH